MFLSFVTVEQANLSVDFPMFVVGIFDGRVVLRRERPLDELNGHGGLAHAAVANHHQLRAVELQYGSTVNYLTL